VTPPERPAAPSFTSVPRSLAAAASPAIAGALFAGGLEAWPLVICGVLKIAYDLLLLKQVPSPATAGGLFGLAGTRLQAGLPATALFAVGERPGVVGGLQLGQTPRLCQGNGR